MKATQVRAELRVEINHARMTVFGLLAQVSLKNFLRELTKISFCLFVLGFLSLVSKGSCLIVAGLEYE